MKPQPESAPDRAIRDAAVAWVIRRDRGLSAAESIEFELWLAADERHAAALERLRTAWSLLDQIPEEIAEETLQIARRRRRLWRVTSLTASLAAAAAIVIAAFVDSKPQEQSRPSVGTAIASRAVARALALSDGSLVRLNTGAEIHEQFTVGERRILLVRGEAHFSVMENPARPFVVRAANIEIRAVGTAFGVTLQSAAVEVLVTEGVVKLDPARAVSRTETHVLPHVSSGHRAVLALNPVSAESAIVVTSVSKDEIMRALAWHEPLLRLGGSPLGEVAASFERRTGRKVIFADRALADLPVGGRFRADDVEGFTRLLTTILDLEVEHTATGALVLRKKTATPP